MGKIGHKWKLLKLGLGVKKPPKEQPQVEEVVDPDLVGSRNTETGYKGKNCEKGGVDEDDELILPPPPQARPQAQPQVERKKSIVEVHHHVEGNFFSMIACDLDGTLLNDNGVLTKETISALKAANEAGAKVTLVTGRSVANCYQYVIECGFTMSVIACNGAFGCLVDRDGCQTTPDEALFNEGVILSDVQTALEYSAKHSIACQYYAGDLIYNNSSEEEHYHVSRFYSKKTKTPQEFVSDNFEEAMTFSMPSKLLFLSHEELKIDKLARALKRYLPNCVIIKGNMSDEQSAYFIEITHGDVNKGFGLVRLCEELEVSINDVVAFGDSDNDIQFLEAAGLGICMNNSSAELEKVADEKLGDNNHENGVAKKVVAMIEGKNFVKPPPPPIPHPDILRLDQLS